MAKGERGGPETRLGFLDLLLIVWFSGTPGGEFRDEPARGGGAARGSWVRAGSRNFLRGGAAALSSFPSPGSFTPRWLPRATCGLSGREQGCLGEAVMRGLWEKTGPERTGNAVEARQGSARPWEVGVLEPGEGTQSRPENHKPMICPSAPSQPPRSRRCPAPGSSNTEP